MTHLRYKDYQGAVTFVDGTLLIQILHIDDYVTTQSDDARSVQAAFEELVDDYIQTCIEQNKEPSKPFKGSFNVRIAPDVHRAVAMRAIESGMSMNSWIEKALSQEVSREVAMKRWSNASYMAKLFDTSKPFAYSKWHSETVDIEVSRDPVLATRAFSVWN
ncbi:type II toxin-antitoxin system HicB family antitoxin [Tardiphaga sp. 768_D3_N2_1]|uniref:type II toxin-antitoxin system HicB family antitoxin n=1 Tax=Tardiphaga sp. 768_D3_N2_1 TaxID=3240783 RepID=UPI003F892420